MAAESLITVYATYLLASASPGPSIMAIMGTAMDQGRRPALLLAAGVLLGSITWAGLAGTGLTALLATHPEFLSAVRIAGGCYLLYLAYKAATSACQTGDLSARTSTKPFTPWQQFRQGYFMHLTNPKAVLSWSAILSLALSPERQARDLPLIVGGCFCLGFIVFCGYALAFSTRPASRIYARARRAIQAGLALAFLSAGLSLIFLKG